MVDIRRQVNVVVTFRREDGSEFTMRFHPDTVAPQKHLYAKKGFVLVKEEPDDPKARAKVALAALSKPAKAPKQKADSK